MSGNRLPAGMNNNSPDIIPPLDLSVYPTRKVAIAMSGGVDSSVSAALLSNAGFDVTGFTMRLFRDESGKVDDTITHAASTARQLGIDHTIVDLCDEFDHSIATYFTGEYIAARTPNPCVLCNRLIKWELLGKLAREHGCDLLATGHYVRIARFSDDTRTLVRGTDKNKDQSYFLWRLDSALLEHTIFPLGSMTKQETRKHAVKLGLDIAEKPESQEICFIPDNDYRNYLERRITTEPIPHTMKDGDFIDSQGSYLGRHRGAAFYTIGQRRGLGIAVGYPLYVTKLDASTNKITVGPRDHLAAKTFTVSDLHWIRGFAPGDRFKCTIRIRYRHPGVSGIVVPKEGLVTFDISQDAVTPGQSAVFYNGDYVLGGGIIENPL